MSKMSLRTKGLILIVLISFIPLLLAGAGNYSAVKKAILDAEMDKIGSKLGGQADNIAAWLDIRRAEVLVMSRTSVVRFGASAERKNYFQRELSRSGFTYHSIGFIDKEGLAVRSDGPDLDMSGEPFLASALAGRVVITDPYRPAFSLIEQSFIVVPVYGIGTDIVGVIYGSIPFTSLNRFFTFAEASSPVRFYNDGGDIIYSTDPTVAPNSSIKEDAVLSHVSDQMLNMNEGRVRIGGGDGPYMVFYAKVAGTPWRVALAEPMAKLEALLSPIFWRTVTTIALSEIIIAVVFYLYFERIVKRLEGILRVTEQAAAGQFKAEHLDTSQRDEIGQLAHSVNGMMEHLQEMFDRLRAIINQNQYGFIVLDERYRIMFLNEAAEEMLGYKTEELEGHATPLVFMDIDEIEQEAGRLSEELGREVLPGLAVFDELRRISFSYEREWTFIHKNGTRIPMLQSSSGLRDKNGNFAGVVGMVRDISDRKHVEKARNRLLDIVESAKDLIASIDQGGNIIYMNRAGKEMLGLALDSDADQTVEQHAEPHMYEQLLKGAELAKEYGFWESDTRLVKLNGEPLFVSMVVVAHCDVQTGEMFYSCIARDISEQRMVQEELVRAKLEAEEANKAKSRFLALMSHEIRTPLNGIIGLTSLMRKTELSLVQKDYMDKMHMSSETLLRIINDVLDFSKIEADKIEVESFPFQPEELLHRLANQLSVFLGGKEQFEFIIKTPERLPVMLIGDSMRLEQVLLNLCMNAIKFTDAGRVKLELSIVGESEDSVSVKFLIEDTGIGMSQEQVERLFKPFTQADSSTTRKFGGTGLGLVISKSLVELMGGKLLVSSEEGVGSSFRFTLKFAADPYRYESGQRHDAFRKEQTVWLAEDDEAMKEHWMQTLEGFGLSVIVYDSWQAMMERLRRAGEGARPQLVMADMEMPDMYGIDTWRRLRRIAYEAGIPVVAYTTTYGRDELLQLPLEDRPSSILIKPATSALMLRALKDTLEPPVVREQHAAAAPSKSPVPVVSPAPRKVNVLLAEDNKINQLVAIEMLKECGCGVSLAENGQEALELLGQGSWDLILMDIHMPVMDGTEAVRLIRGMRQYDDIPIIAVTANVVKKDHEHYLKLGMNDVITKPLSAERLQETLDYWLEKQSSSAQSPSRSDGAPSEAEKIRLEHYPPLAVSAAPAPLAAVAGMDVDNALKRVNGKQAILLHMMEQFSLDYRQFMDQLRMALERSDSTEALRMLHTLRGAAGYLAAHGLEEAARNMEKRLKQDHSSDVPELELAARRLDRELGRLLSGLAAAKTSFDNKI